MSKIEWIPASQLPENVDYGWSESMIVVQFGPNDLRPFRLLASYDHSRSQWRTASGPVENITYWQPLPDLPKEYKAR